MLACRRRAIVTYVGTGEELTSWVHFEWPCNDAMCSPCCEYRSSAAAEAARTYICRDPLRPDPLVLVTLTQLDIKGESLASALQRFEPALKRLVKRKYWRDRAAAWRICLDFSWNGREKWWHVHAHILVDRKPSNPDRLELQWNELELSETWAKATRGQSARVHIEPAHPDSEEWALIYGLKVPYLEGDQLLEYVTTMTRRRRSRSGGDWYGRRCGEKTLKADAVDRKDREEGGPEGVGHEPNDTVPDADYYEPEGLGGGERGTFDDRAEDSEEARLTDEEIDDLAEKGDPLALFLRADQERQIRDEMERVRRADEARRTRRERASAWEFEEVGESDGKDAAIGA